jgi:hypothetical protein
MGISKSSALKTLCSNRKFHEIGKLFMASELKEEVECNGERALTETSMEILIKTLIHLGFRNLRQRL